MANGPPEAIKNHAAFIWSVADLLRGDYKQSAYRKVFLPLTVAPPVRLRPRSGETGDARQVSATGDYQRWIRFFCEGVRAQAEASASKIADLLAFQQYAVATARGTGRHNVSVDIAGDLIERPVLTVTDAKDRYGVSFPAANNAVARLVELGLLSEITGRTQDRVFRADEVLRILER